MLSSSRHPPRLPMASRVSAMLATAPSKSPVLTAPLPQDTTAATPASLYRASSTRPVPSCRVTVAASAQSAGFAIHPFLTTTTLCTVSKPRPSSFNHGGCHVMTTTTISRVFSRHSRRRLHPHHRSCEYDTCIRV